VQQQSAAYRARINELVGELNSVNAALNTLKTTVGTLRASQVDIEARFKKMTTKPRPPTVSSAVTPPLTYTVKALVPGRAWLQASNGRLMTVKVGDTLPRYGVVRTISPEHGQLITSRGTVIRYGPDE
jgi:intracellular multiplication protein IcmG